MNSESRHLSWQNAGGFVGEVTLILLGVKLLGVVFDLYDRDIHRAASDARVWLFFAAWWAAAFLRKAPRE